MPTIAIEGGATFACAPDDTILRAALRAGHALSYDCNVGACGGCKATLLAGEIESLWPEAPGLSDRDRRKGRFLACQARPRGDCVIAAREATDERPLVAPLRQSARIVAVDDLNHDMRRLVVATGEPARFLPGQYALLSFPDGPTRAYSMANLPGGDWEFMIRRKADGAAGKILFDPAFGPGAALTLDGPYGHAFLRDDGRDVVCVAGGSGLAPMLSIARAVAAEPSARRVVLFQGAREQRDIFARETIAGLPGFGGRVEHVLALSQGAAPDCASGFVHELVAARAAVEFATAIFSPPARRPCSTPWPPA
jgi:toluene monooxygenase electron transfer component